MGKLALMVLVTASVLSAGITGHAQRPAASQSGGAGRNRIVGYTAWDDDFLYFAIHVNKPTIQAGNSQAFSNPLQDDAVVLSLQTDDNHTSNVRTDRTLTIALSAAGGSQMYLGASGKPLHASLAELTAALEKAVRDEKDVNTAQQHRAELLGRLIKYQVVPGGTPREGAANFPGYSFELAIPWVDLGGKPASGVHMGFAVTAQSVASGSPRIQSLSPLIKTIADTENPALFGHLSLTNAPSKSSRDLVIAPRIYGGKPAIDGEIRPGEWNRLSEFQFGDDSGAPGGPADRSAESRTAPPITALPPRGAVIDAQPVPQPAGMHGSERVPSLVMARYDYWYQGDPRKPMPSEHVSGPNGASVLLHHPLDGAGPWFSYDRADWHRKQLQEVRKAGIDVVLPVYRGDTHSRALYADKGLSVMATALRYLSNADQDYPQVAMLLDTTSVADQLGGPVDLRDEKARAAMYRMVRDFYSRIPVEFRYALSLPNAHAVRAYPVFLSSAAPFSAWDQGFVSDLRARFAADFGGDDLVILGAPEFAKSAKLDGYFSETREKGFQFNNTGWISTASVGAGFDNMIETSTGDATRFRARREGLAYREDWTNAISRRPNWVLIDGWNDYETASEVGPSLESGFSLADITRVYTRRFAGASKIGAKFLGTNAPHTIAAGAATSLSVRVQNTGLQTWGSQPGLTPIWLTSRWVGRGQGGKSTVTPVPGTVLPGQSVTVTVAVPTPATGDSNLRVALSTSAKRTDAGAGLELTDDAITIPIATADTPFAASIIRSDLPAIMENGSAYTVNASVRNDGASAWKKADGARVTIRMARVAGPDEVVGGSPLETDVPISDATAVLDRDVAPGQTAPVSITFALVTPDGKPLPAWAPGDQWTYAPRWEVAVRGSDNKAHGTALAAVPAVVTAYDFGVRIIRDESPLSLPGERRVPVTISLQNVGPQAWKKGEVRVGYHWYYEDGAEFLWEDETTPINQDVAPGGRVENLLAWVTAPPRDGVYWLVWDVKFGDTWASTAASTRPFDISVRQVQVVGSRLTFPDLSKSFNVIGSTNPENMASGDFDGSGNSFPATFMPPYSTGPIAPAAMWSPSPVGPESPRGVSYRWGPKEPGEKNFIACRGQKIDFSKTGGQCRLLHILAASSGKDVSGELKMIFQEPSGQSVDLTTITASRWDQPPTHGEEVALVAPRHNSRTGVQSGAVALFHYVIKVHDPRILVGLALPNAPELKIAAITLER